MKKYPSKKVILKDDIMIERRPFTLNANKNRRYRIILDNEVIASNLLYSDLRYVLKMVRNSMKVRKKTMRYSMYNAVIYDGIDAYVSKFVLVTDEQQAMYDLKKYWSAVGYDGEILKIDKLYPLELRNIIAFEDNEEYKNTFERFNEMYFIG